MFANYLQEFLTVAVIHLLGVMSPGPDFLMITRNSLVYSKKTGIWSAVGLGLGILVHVTYSLVGIALIISQSPWLFNLIKYIGAGYLIWIGYQAMRSKGHKASHSKLTKKEDLTTTQALRLGFITNVTNPKVTIFFLALFTQVISTTTPKWIQAIYGLEMSVATFLWFALVALVLSQPLVKDQFLRFSVRLDQAFGVLLIILGIKVAFF